MVDRSFGGCVESPVAGRGEDACSASRRLQRKRAAKPDNGLSIAALGA